jgi:hypothetical protein
MLIYNKDASFEFDDKTLLNANAPIKQGNTPASSAFNKPLKTPNNNASQDDYLLTEPALFVSEDQLTKTDQD